jgi:hypothetical protein
VNALDHEQNHGSIEELLQRARAAAVLQKAVRVFRKRNWARKFALVDPALKELVDEEREVEHHIREEARRKVERGPDPFGAESRRVNQVGPPLS